MSLFRIVCHILIVGGVFCSAISYDLPLYAQTNSSNLQKDEDVLGYVNGINIYTKEMEKLIRNNLSQIREQTKDESSFIEACKQVARYEKSVEILAESYELPTNSDYKALNNLREKTNHSRQLAKKAGKIIFGPVSYNMQSFYNKYRSDLMKSLQKIALQQEEIKEECLKQWYEEHPHVYKHRDQITFSMTFTKGLTEDAEKTEVYVLNENSAFRFTSMMPDIIAKVEESRIGENFLVKGPVQSYRIKVLKIEKGEDIPFEEVKQQIQYELMGNLLNDKIESIMKNTQWINESKASDYYFKKMYQKYIMNNKGGHHE